jgi:hypothetical protein
MMKNLQRSITNWIVACIIILMLPACAARKYTRIASDFEQAEMFSLAVDNYAQSLLKKSANNEKAQIGLMRAAKRYSDELEANINDAYSFLNDDKVVALYMELRQLKSKLAAYQVDVYINQKTHGQFEEARNRHLHSTYTNAQQLLERERFLEAERLFAEVLKIDKNYERALELHEFSQCEPLYRKGRNNLEMKLYRSAYNDFSKLVSINRNYKDARALQKEAQQFATLTVAIQPVINGRNHPHLAYQLEEMTTAEFVKKAHPLLKIVSPNYAREMLEEQRFALTNNLPFDASLVMPVRIFLSARIAASHYSTSPVQRKEKKAFLRYVDRDRKETFKKVLYYEYTQSASATIQLDYEYIRVENATVIAKEMIQRQFSDQVNYAATDYDIRNLLPGDWGDGRRDTIYTDFVRINAMKKMFEARSVLMDKASFENNFAALAAAEIYKKIQLYDPEK